VFDRRNAKPITTWIGKLAGHMSLVGDGNSPTSAIMRCCKIEVNKKAGENLAPVFFIKKIIVGFISHLQQLYLVTWAGLKHDQNVSTRAQPDTKFTGPCRSKARFRPCPGFEPSPSG
jgi:hypothetical protein